MKRIVTIEISEEINLKKLRSDRYRYRFSLITGQCLCGEKYDADLLAEGAAVIDCKKCQAQITVSVRGEGPTE